MRLFAFVASSLSPCTEFLAKTKRDALEDLAFTLPALIQGMTSSGHDLRPIVRKVVVLYQKVSSIKVTNVDSVNMEIGIGGSSGTKSELEILKEALRSSLVALRTYLEVGDIKIRGEREVYTSS